MKEQEKNEIKLLSDKLDALNRKEPQLLESGDVEKLGALLKEKEALVIEIERLRGQRVKTQCRGAEAAKNGLQPRNYQERAGKSGRAEEKRARPGRGASNDRAGT